MDYMVLDCVADRLLCHPSACLIIVVTGNAYLQPSAPAVLELITATTGTDTTLVNGITVFAFEYG